MPTKKSKTMKSVFTWLKHGFKLRKKQTGVEDKFFGSCAFDLTDKELRSA